MKLLRICTPAAALIAALLACSMPVQEQPTTAPVTVAVNTPLVSTLTPVVSTPVIGGDQPTQDTASVVLDLCTLITQPEAEAVVGAPVQVQGSPDLGNCSYTGTAVSEGKPPRTISVSAAQGGEANGLLLAGIGMLMMFGGDEDAQQQFEDLQAQSANKPSTNPRTVIEF